MNTLKQLNKDIAELDKRRVEMEGQSEWGSWEDYDGELRAEQRLKMKEIISSIGK